MEDVLFAPHTLLKRLKWVIGDSFRVPRKMGKGATFMYEDAFMVCGGIRILEEEFEGLSITSLL